MTDGKQLFPVIKVFLLGCLSRRAHPRVARSNLFLGSLTSILSASDATCLSARPVPTAVGALGVLVTECMMQSDTFSFVLFLFPGPASPSSKLHHQQVEVRSGALCTTAVAEPLGGAEPTPLTDGDRASGSVHGSHVRARPCFS